MAKIDWNPVPEGVDRGQWDAMTDGQRQTYLKQRMELNTLRTEVGDSYEVTEQDKDIYYRIYGGEDIEGFKKYLAEKWKLAQELRNARD